MKFDQAKIGIEHGQSARLETRRPRQVAIGIDQQPSGDFLGHAGRLGRADDEYEGSDVVERIEALGERERGDRIGRFRYPKHRRPAQ